ncbi:MAG: M28 family peptidase [Bacteroidetes bacterium]|nr:M28 family peptidase [Bacteroidota bacterium]
MKRILTPLLLLLLFPGVSCSQDSAGTGNFEPSVDAMRLLSHVEILSSDAYMGRRAGTEGGHMAQAYVQQQFEELGLQPACSESFVQTFPFTASDSSPAEGANLIAVIPGTGSAAGSVVVSAHYDPLGTRNGEVYNGADDNASGTAALIELAREFTANPPEHDILFAAFDAEELGLVGARAFVRSDCFTASDVRLNINMDMISRSGAGELYASGTYHYPFLRPLIDGVPRKGPLTVLFGHDEPSDGFGDWTASSDHAPFNSAGVPFVYFGVEDHPGYHNPSDDFDAITPEFFTAAVSWIHDVLRVLDGAVDSFPD